MNRFQEILDRCWNALPDECPMRGWDRKTFDIVWGAWSPAELARIDPTCAMEWSILFVGVITSSALTEQKDAITQHYLWLMESSNDECFREWNKAAEKCLENFQAPNQQLISFITVAEILPVLITEDDSGGTGLWGASQQARIKKYCIDSDPELFSGMSDNDAWRSVVNNAKNHLGIIPQAKAGRPRN